MAGQNVTREAEDMVRSERRAVLLSGWRVQAAMEQAEAQIASLLRVLGDDPAHDDVVKMLKEKNVEMADLMSSARCLAGLLGERPDQ